MVISSLYIFLLAVVTIMFSQTSFQFPENQVGGEGFVEIVSNIPTAMSFSFNVNGGAPKHQCNILSIAKIY